MTLTKLVAGFALLVAFSACSKKDDTPELSTAKEITAFSIDTAKGVIDAATHTITVQMASSTDVTKLKPVIKYSENATVSPASETVVDFTNPVTFTVKAQNGTTQAYTVTVVKAPGAEILAFKIEVEGGYFYEGKRDSLDRQLVKVGMTDYLKTLMTKAKPVITVSPGATIAPASGEEVDLTKPVTYTVTSEKGEVKTFTVKILNNQRFFSFNAPYQGASELYDHFGIVTLVGNGSTYAEDEAGLTGYAGLFEALDTEDVSALALNITLPTGMTISPNPATPQNYNKDVTYTLTNEMGETHAFTVRCLKRKGIIVNSDIYKNGTNHSTNISAIRFWSEIGIDKLWFVDTTTKEEYETTPSEATISGGLYLSWLTPAATTPAGNYAFKILLKDGTVYTTRMSTQFVWE